MCVQMCVYDGGGLVAKSCLTLATPWSVACQAPLFMGSPGKNTGVGCHFLLQCVCVCAHIYIPIYIEDINAYTHNFQNHFGVYLREHIGKSR